MMKFAAHALAMAVAVAILSACGGAASAADAAPARSTIDSPTGNTLTKPLVLGGVRG
jgi:ABC-type glycerol-3-phosphate transport system substrate-binding protein